MFSISSQERLVAKERVRDSKPAKALLDPIAREIRRRERLIKTLEAKSRGVLADAEQESNRLIEKCETHRKIIAGLRRS